MCKAYHNCTAELTSIDSTCIRRIIAVFGKIRHNFRVGKYQQIVVYVIS